MIDAIIDFTGKYVINPVIRFARYLVIDSVIEGLMNGIRKLRDKIRDKWQNWRERCYWR